MQNWQKAIKYWSDSSKYDFSAAKILFENGRYNHALFFCHLSLEKKLKAIIVKKLNISPPYMHDLVRLAEKAYIAMNDFMRVELAEISTFNIAARYDDLKLNFAKKANKRFAGKYYKKDKGNLSMAKQRALDKTKKENVRKFIALARKQGIKISKVILFGSYAKGTFTSDSDIDLAVVSPQFGHNSIEEMMLLRKIAILVDSQLEPVPLSPSGFNDRYSSLSNEIRRYGIPIE
jgi:predicted nucleotidyltransferase/HEPN domain-containing protein